MADPILVQFPCRHPADAENAWGSLDYHHTAAPTATGTLHTYRIDPRCKATVAEPECAERPEVLESFCTEATAPMVVVLPEVDVLLGLLCGVVVLYVLWLLRTR